MSLRLKVALMSTVALALQPDKTFGPASKVCILGGGLQGSASAYYLAERGFTDVTVVERSSIAAAASGKGGGFLARGWGQGATKRLHEESFDLHADLAAKLELKSYRAIPTLEVTGELAARGRRPQKQQQQQPSWLDSKDTSAKLMDPGTAQVVPRELCERLFEASGAKLVSTAARGFETTEDGETLKITHVKTDDGDIEADVVVCAMGPWSVLLEDWLGEKTGLRIPIEGVYSTSIVFEGNDAVKTDPNALFCAEDSNSCHLECYPRVDGSVYLCGIGGSDYVSGARLREGGDLQDASKAVANPARVEAAKASFSAMAPSVAAGKEPKITQACMRPCAPDALPLLGIAEAVPNLVIATGHNCWGILWAPITGKIVSELIADGVSKTADISKFKPERFMQKKSKRGRANLDNSVGEQW